MGSYVVDIPRKSNDGCIAPSFWVAF